MSCDDNACLIKKEKDTIFPCKGIKIFGGPCKGTWKLLNPIGSRIWKSI